MNPKPLVVLDLDETLWHGEIDAAGEVTDFQIRPYLTEFIADVSPHYDIAVWSAGTRDWITEAFKRVKDATSLDFDALCKFVWDRTKCTQRSIHNYEPYGGSYGDPVFFKPVRKLRTNSKPRQYPHSRILVVDDKPLVYSCGYGHLIRVSEWKGNPSDYELIQLASYLVSIKDEPNFRALEKRGWKGSLVNSATITW